MWVVTTSLRSLIDRLHDGQFDARLRKMRSDGLSYRQIADALEDEGYEVSHETVRQWVLELDPDNGTAA